MTDRDADLRRPGTAEIANTEDTLRNDPRILDREVKMRGLDGRADDGGHLRLLPDDVVDELRPQWADIQASFVDQPRRSVEQADALVADAIRRLAESFAKARSDLEHEWDRGEDVSTEDLRVALTRYRKFFDKLLDF